MSSPQSGSGRRRTTARQYSAEDQALDQISKEAENRLALRRAARAEARDIRIRELERQQKEAEEKEKQKELGGQRNATYSNSSRRSSDESTTEDDSRQIKKDLLEVEDKYKKAMMNIAQLGNEKQTYRYQVDVMKDDFEELEEKWLELQRQYKDRCRELEQKKRDYKDILSESEFLKQQLEIRDKLITEYGLVFVSNETVNSEKTDKKKKKKKGASEDPGTTALVTPSALEILGKVEGNLDDRLKSFATEKEELESRVKELKQKLDEERERNALAEKYSSPKAVTTPVNGPSDTQMLEAQMEAQKQLNEYKFKLKKQAQDITTLEGNVIRLESQVKRYKSASENSEKLEDELKAEKRKLQRELREAVAQMSELQTENSHLQKRLDKVKQARNALLKS